jgi:hypothetical protein
MTGTETISSLPLFGGQLETVTLRERPTQAALLQCRACFGTGRANIGTKKRPHVVYCFCDAGSRAYLLDQAAADEG